MKKRSIPDTSGQPTSEFVQAVKDNIEVFAGRRKNKITVPTLQTLTFSATPTKAECDALNAYLNAWGAAFKLLVARFDE